MTTFLIIAAVVLGSAIAAVSLRNLVHCALALTVSLAGIGILFLKLGAQFAGFAQILVYIGAVAILIVFAILLTRGAEEGGTRLLAPRWGWGIAIAILLSGTLCTVVLSSSLITRPQPYAFASLEMSVRKLGSELMTRYVLPLEVVGLLLTAALIGAVVIAMRNEGDT